MPDSDELAFLADFTKWMDVNGEGIYGTRPWGVFGEGPGRRPGDPGQGLNEGNRKYTAQDFRFMQKGDSLYAYAMAWPDDGKLAVKSLATGAGKVQDVKLLGFPGKLVWSQTDQGLIATLPEQKPCDYVYGLQIQGNGLTPVPVPVVSTAVVVEPQASGAIVLSAATATLHGDSPQIETKSDVKDIGYWGASSDTVSWDYDVTVPGAYAVTVNSACAPEGAGSGFTLETAGQSLPGATTSTGSWDTFTDKALGTLTFAQAGKQTLTIKPQASWKGIALRSVTLTKTP